MMRTIRPAESPVRCLVNTGLVVVSGEITTETYVDIPQIARETIREIGYDDPTLWLRRRHLRAC